MPTWMTIQEAANYLRVSKKTVYRYIEQGRLKFYTMPSGRKRFKQSDLDALLQKGAEGHTPP